MSPSGFKKPRGRRGRWRHGDLSRAHLRWLRAAQLYDVGPWRSGPHRADLEGAVGAQWMQRVPWKKTLSLGQIDEEQLWFFFFFNLQVCWGEGWCILINLKLIWCYSQFQVNNMFEAIGWRTISTSSKNRDGWSRKSERRWVFSGPMCSTKIAK